MLSLIIAILFGLSITFFAFQNAGTVPINFAGYQFAGIPLYIVVIASALAGIMMAWFISAIDGVSSLMRIRKKESIINEDKKVISNLESKVSNLERENARLKGGHKEVVAERRVEHHNDAVADHKPSFFEKIFPNSTRRYSKQD